MTVTDAEVKQLSNSNPDPAEQTDEQSDMQDAQGGPKTLAADQIIKNASAANGLLNMPNPNGPNNVPFAPGVAKNGITPTPPQVGTKDDFSATYGAKLGDLLAFKALSGIPTPPGRAMAPFIAASLPALGAPEGSISPEAASSNADATRPTVGIPPAPSPQVQGARNILQSFAAGAAHQGSPFGAISANIDAQNQQYKDALTNASTLVHTLHEQQVMHSLGEEQVAKGIDSGTKGLNLLLNSHHPGTLLAEGKTSDEIKDMIAKKQIDTKNSAIFLTGRVQTGVDKATGDPLYRSTYSVATPGGPVTFSSENGNMDEANYINDNLGLKKGDPRYIDENQQLPAAQVNRLYTQAQLADANNAAAQQSAATNNMKREAAQLAPDAQKIQNSDEFAKAWGDTADKGNPNDPDHMVKAYLALKATAAKTLGMSPERFEAAFREFATGGGADSDKDWSTMQANYQKHYEALIAKRDAMLSNTMAIEHPEGAAAAANSAKISIARKISEQQAIIASPSSSDEQKAAAKVQIASLQADADRVQGVLDVAQQTLTNKQNEKAAEAESTELGRQKAASTNATDFPNDLEAVLRYDVDPEKLFGKNRSSALASFMEQVQSTAKARGIDWTEAEYKKRYNTVQAFGPSGQIGKSIGNVDTFVGHAAAADNNIGQLWNTRSEWLNKPITAYYQSVQGRSNAAKMRTDLAVASEEWIKFIQGTGTLTDHDKQTAEKIVNENSSPQVIHDALAEMAQTAKIRATTLNDQYRQTMKKEYPTMWSPRVANLLQNQFGINVRDGETGGIEGEGADVKNANAANTKNPPATATRQNFDVAAWKTANPGKDVDKAIAKAKSLGYNVIGAQ